MDPSIHDELVECDPCHLAADRVEPADDYRFGGIVHDEVDPRGLLEGTDVAALLADDAALQLVGRERKHRNGNFRGLVGGDALDRLGHDLPSAALAFIAGRQLGFADLARDFVAQVLLHLGHQDSLGFLPRHVGDALELSLLLAIALFELAVQYGGAELRLDVVQPFLLVRHLALAPVQVLALAVEVFLLLKKTLFDLLRLRAILAGLLFGGGPDLDRLLFGLQELFLGLGFRLEHRLLGLELQDMTPIALPALEQHVSHPKASGEGHHCHSKKQYVDVDRHVKCTSLFDCQSA